MRNHFINRIIESCAINENIFILSGDAGLGVFDDFRKAFPDRFRNMGVAEQNMIGFAAGLALTGFKVFAYNIIPFVLYRCFEHIRNDICYQNLDVTLVGTGSGVTYAPSGMTHYAVEDIGLCRTLPNLKVFSPSDPVEARCVAEYTLHNDGPNYVRLAKSGEPVFHKKPLTSISSPLYLKKGRTCAILFHGSIAEEVISAAEALEKKGVDISVISVPFLQPLKIETLKPILDGYTHILTVEEHYENTGLGAILSHHHSIWGAKWQLHILGIKPEYIHAVKKCKSLRDYYGISSDHIIKKIKSILKLQNT